MFLIKLFDDDDDDDVMHSLLHSIETSEQKRFFAQERRSVSYSWFSQRVEIMWKYWAPLARSC